MLLSLDPRPSNSNCNELVLKSQNVVYRSFQRAGSYRSIKGTSDSRIQVSGSGISSVPLLHNKVIQSFLVQPNAHTSENQRKFWCRYPVWLLRLNESCKSSHSFPARQGYLPCKFNYSREPGLRRWRVGMCSPHLT